MTYQLFNEETMNAPWGLKSRHKLVALACKYFDVENPHTGYDFLQYISRNGIFQKKPNAFRVAKLLKQMVECGLLNQAGHRNNSTVSLNGLGDYYFHVKMKWDLSRGDFLLTKTLGPEFLYQICVPGLVHITGTMDNDTPDNGEVVAGTGIVINPSYVLTCRHVVDDMKLDECQKFQNHEFSISSIDKHPVADIALLHVNKPDLVPLRGLKYQQPVVAQTIFTLGYPKLPGFKNETVVIQQGAVTNENVTTLSDEHLFLFSAISRPGNSGGPVMSEDGYLVGLGNLDARGEYQNTTEVFSPHYCGIPGHIVVDAVKYLNPKIQLPFEIYE